MNLKHIKKTVGRLFWRSETELLHLILATASLGWFIALLALDPPNNAPAFRLMYSAAAPWQWSILFLLHVVGFNVCLFAMKERPRCKTVIQFYGVTLWISITALQFVSLGRFTPSSALEVVICGFAVWAIFRAGAPK